jgi:long-chain acyl-CoA synthetase
MDGEGFIYFRMRLKRMVKVSGIAVYPPQVEEVLRGHEAVRDVCVVGVPDPYKMNVIRAYVVLSEAAMKDRRSGKPENEITADILQWASDRLNRWSLPKDIVFRRELPLTRVGKVAYTELEREAAQEMAG